MRGVLVEVPESLLAERRRTGADVRDELWEGELHMVPPPLFEHQRFETRLAAVLLRIADAAGLVLAAEAGVWDPDAPVESYRVPDIVVAAPERISARGVEGGPAVVIEIRSPGDETYAKLDFYARIGPAEMLVIDRDTKAVELFLPVGGELRPSVPDADGWFRSRALGIGIRPTGEGRVEITTNGSTTLV